MIIRWISSLEKCFPEERVYEKRALTKASMLKNERYSLQLCYQLDPQKPAVPTRSYACVEAAGPLKDFVRIRRVSYVPVPMPTYATNGQTDTLRTEAGLFPDPLTELKRRAVPVHRSLNALWIDVEGELPAGVHPLTLRFVPVHSGTLLPKEGLEAVEATVELEVIDACLPEQTTKVTQWFYCDCLQSYYGTEAFDERHWQIIEEFMRTAVKNGINTILTPLLTPPLDTAVGGERPTTQLVKIKKEKERYSFDFSRLERWVALCDRLGVKYFEVNHMFTQWGAACCPKVVAEVNGREERIFGWDTPSTGEEYKSFLSQLIPAFLEKMKSLNGADKRCYFHLSDEPSEKHLANYKAVRELFLPLVEGYPVIDALSHVEFFDQGLVEIPVPSSSHIAPFLERDIRERWTYYCLGMGKESNRFFCFPSYRNRILGAQMYKFGVKGFLHWGYNFYFSQFSHYEIDPWICTDGDGFAPSGDPFVVYPGKDGSCVESLRLRVFADALQDQRALELCESLYGKDYAVSLIDEGIEPLRFDNYPRDPDYLLRLRERVNAAIKAKVQGSV